METAWMPAAFAAYILDTLSRIIYSIDDGFILNAPRRGHG